MEPIREYPSRAERIARWIDENGPTLRLRCRARRRCKGRPRKCLAETCPIYTYRGPWIAELEEPR